VAAADPNALVLDRIAVIVGSALLRPAISIKTCVAPRSSIGSQSATDPDNKRRSAERLIDQEIIRQEIINGGFRRPAESQAAALEPAHARSLCGSDARLRAEVMHYGLSEGDLREHLLWQLTVLSFIDQRFQAGAAVRTRCFALTTISIWRISAAKINKPAAMRPWRHRSGTSRRRARKSKFQPMVSQARSRYRIEYKQEALK